jgi:hypothetical protein
MRTHLVLFVMVAQLISTALTATAHPGSGIVADDEGNVYFTATGEWQPGLWRIDPMDQVTRLGTTGAHWLALDELGSFANADLDGWFRQRISPWLKRMPLPSSRGSVLQADGSPTVVTADGSLCYVKGLELARLSPDGKVTTNVAAPGFKGLVDKLGGIKGLARDKAGMIYATCPSAILTISTDGKFRTIMHPVKVPDCDQYLPPGTPAEYAPYLTGLTVGADGVIYAAATGCRRVIRISPKHEVTVVLKAEPPWSPTGVALHGDDIYVLEHTRANDDTHEWQPRVRKITRGGKISTVVTIPRDAR